MSKIKMFLKKFLYGEKADSQTYVKYLRKLGMSIGERTVIYSPTKTLIDCTRPWLITIGDDVQITEGVKILTHGFDWSVLKGVYGEVLGSSGKVKIDNNVFIGVNTTILKGVHIGNNVIVGANSLVNKDIPKNVVAAGNPCKVIMSLEDYYRKRKDAQMHEVKELVQEYRKCYGKEPDEKVLREFFWLFTNSTEGFSDDWMRLMRVGGNENRSKELLRANNLKYKNMHDFLNSIK